MRRAVAQFLEPRLGPARVQLGAPTLFDITPLTDEPAMPIPADMVLDLDAYTETGDLAGCTARLAVERAAADRAPEGVRARTSRG